MKLKVEKLEERKHLWSQNKVRKESSPTAKAVLNGVYFQSVIDEGSEVNCISEDLISTTGIGCVNTLCSASTADSSKMKVVGQTGNSVTITILHEKPVVWNLGKCVVIKNFKCTAVDW